MKLFRFSSPSVAFVLVLTFSSWGSPQEEKNWQAEWKKTVEAARQEGQVNVYIYNTAASAIHAGVFQKAFPGIKVVAVSGRGVESRQRVLSERRAGKYLADVLSSGSGEDALDSLRIDIPKDEVPVGGRRVEGTTYLELDTEGRLDMRPIIKLFEESLSEAAKKRG